MYICVCTYVCVYIYGCVCMCMYVHVLYSMYDMCVCMYTCLPQAIWVAPLLPQEVNRSIIHEMYYYILQTCIIIVHWLCRDRWAPLHWQLQIERARKHHTPTIWFPLTAPVFLLYILNEKQVQELSMLKWPFEAMKKEKKKNTFTL